MDAFGLGLILSFTDNATSGLNSATGALNDLERVANSTMNSVNNQIDGLAAAGMSLSIVGDQVSNLGSSIMGVYSNLIGNIKDTGSEFESFRITLTKLYDDDVAAANEQVDKLMDFSAKTPFEVTDVKDLLITLKSQGIEAFDEMTGASSGFTQANLAWIGDLMAFKPDVPMQRWKIAIQNYLGSGEERVLRNALDMGAIDEILGHDVGDTVEERMQDIIEIVESANLQGLMEDNLGTFNQTVSNLDDQFTKIYLKIADAGPFDKLKESLQGVVGQFTELQDSDLQEFADSVAVAFNRILTPVAELSTKIGDLIIKFIDFTSENPAIAQMAIMVGAVAGAFLLAFGTLLRFSGSIFLLAEGLSRLSQIGPLLFSGFISGVASAIASILPFIALAGVLYLAWTNNTLGIKDQVTEAFTTISLILRAVVAGWNNNYSELAKQPEFQWLRDSGLLRFAAAIRQTRMILNDFFRGFEEGFENFVDAVFGADTVLGNLARSIKDVTDIVADLIFRFLGLPRANSIAENLGYSIGQIAGALLIALPAIKLVSIAFGLLTASPLVTTISLLAAGFLLLKNNVRDAEGNLTPLGETLQSIALAVSSVFDKLFGEEGESPFSDFITNLFDTGSFNIDSITDKLADVFSNIDGEKILGGLLFALIAVFKPTAFLPLLAGIVSGFLGLIPGISNVILLVGEKAGGLLLSVFSKAFGLLPTALQSGLSGLSIVGSTLITKIGALFTTIAGPIAKGASSLLTPLLSGIGGLIGPILSAIGGWPILIGIAIIAAIGAVASIISGGEGTEGLKKKLDAVWEKLPEGIKEPLRQIGDILGNFINSIAEKMGIEDGVEALKGFATQVFDWFTYIGNIVMDIVGNIIDWVKEAWDGWLGDLVGGILEFVGKVVEILMAILPPIIALIGAIIDVVMPIIDVIGSILGNVIEVINGFLDIILGIFTGDWVRVWDGFKSVVEGIVSNVTDIISGIVDIVKGVAKAVADFFDWIFGNSEDSGKAVDEVDDESSKRTGYKTSELQMTDPKTGAVETIVQGATGGYIKSEGLMYVHPNEFLANSELTSGLHSFLKMYENNKSDTEIVPTRETSFGNYSSMDAFLGSISDGLSVEPETVDPIDDLLVEDEDNPRKMVLNASEGNDETPVFNVSVDSTSVDKVDSAPAPVSSTSVDGSIHFEQGSIVIQVLDPKSSDKDLESMAEKLMKIISRKQQLRGFLQREG